MKSHLEEEHPGVMIRILNKKSAETVDNDLTDEERVQEEPAEEEMFTEVLYLEEEPKRKSVNPLKRISVSKKSGLEKKVQNTMYEYKVVPHTVTAPVRTEDRSRPEVESFLSYVRVLLKNVPQESFPRLQLDVISLILNAQMAQSSQIPVPPLVPSTQSVPESLNNSEIPVRVKKNTEDYHIIIENTDSAMDT